MISTTCPGCGSALVFSAWDLLPGRSFPAFSRCSRCLRRVHVPHLWHCATLLVVMALSVAAPFLIGVQALVPALGVFVLVSVPLSIGLSALYIALGGRLVAEEIR